MSNGMVRILFNSLTTLRPVSSMPKFPPTTASISCLSFLVRVRKTTKSELGESIFKLIFLKNSPSRGSNCYSLYQQSWKLRQRKCHHKSIYTRDWNIEFHKGGDLHPLKAGRTNRNHFRRNSPSAWPLVG